MGNDSGKPQGTGIVAIMADAGEKPGDSALDRFMRFGTALFAVPKGELPAREEPAKPPRPPKKAKPAT